MRHLLTIIGALILVSMSATGVVAQKRADELMDRVMADMQHNDISKAITDISEAIKLKPDYGDGYLLRGSFRAMTGDATGALADLTKVIELMPARAQTHFERATLRLANNDATGARADLDSAIAKGYKTDGVYDLRSQIRWQQEDFQGALQDLDAAIALNPDNARYYATRGEMRLIMKDRDGALTDLNYLLGWYENPASRKATGSNSPKAPSGDQPALDAGSKSAADKDDHVLRVGITAETNNALPRDKDMVEALAGAYQHRGLIYSELGKVENAISDFNKSIEVFGKDWAVFYNRAVEREKKGDLAGAMADVNKALQLDPNSGNSRLEHGVILTLLGKTTEAETDFKILIDADSAFSARIARRLEAARKSFPGIRP